jgi:hypothetical protein
MISIGDVHLPYACYHLCFLSHCRTRLYFYVDDANLMGYSINTITINVELITLVGEQTDLAVNTGKGRDIKGIMCAVQIWTCCKITVYAKRSKK